MGFGGLALGLVGAGIGGAAFGPTGAKVGFLIGSSIGTATARSKIPGVEGPRLRDLKVQTSTYGVGIQRIYGRQITKGNVIWATPIKEVEHRSTVGSKAAKQEQITYTYELPGIAIGLCEGEISEILRVWVNDFLVYEAATDADVISGDSESLAYLNQQLAFYAKNVTYRIYKGTATQTADPLIQTYQGVANTPGYRHLAYIVIEDLPLELFGNSVPEFTFEVVAKAKTFQTVNTSISYLHPTYKHLSTWTEGPVPGNTTRMQTGAVQTNLSLNSGQVIELGIDDYEGGPSIRRIAAASLASRTKYNAGFYGSRSGQIVNVFPRFSHGWLDNSSNIFHETGTLMRDFLDIHRIFDDKNETYVTYGSYYEIYTYTGTEGGNGSQGFGNPNDLTKVSCCIYNPSGFNVNNIVRFTRLVSTTSQKIRGVVKLGDKFIIADDSTGAGVYKFYFKNGVVWAGSTSSIVDLTLTQGPTIGTASTHDVSMTSDGTYIYTMYRNMSTNTWVVQKWTSSLSFISSFNLSTLVPSATNEADNRLLAFNDGTIVVMNPYTLKAHVIEGMNLHVDTFDLLPVFIGGTTVMGDYPHWTILGHRDALYVRRTFINEGGSVAQWDIYARILENRTTTGTVLVPIHSLETTVADILKYAGYPDSDIDVSGLSPITNFKGYAIAKPGSTKVALEQLAAAYNFCIVEINSKIVATLQGREPVTYIPKGELGGNDGGSSFDATLLDYTRAPNIDLPSKVRVQYQSDRPILTSSEQYAERLITDHDDTVHVEFSIMMSDDEAAQVAEVLLHSAWAARQNVSFTTSRKFLRLNPNDNVVVNTPDGDFNVRITGREYGVPGLLIFSGYIESGNLTKSSAKGAKTPKVIFRPTPLLPTEIYMLDIPVVSEAENNYGVYYALATTQVGWGGASIWSNKGAGFTQVGTSGELAPIFQVSTLPANHNPFSLDEISTIVLNPLSGDTVLQSITGLAQLYNYNLLLLINHTRVKAGFHNSYEILSFRDATLNIDGDYEVSGLVRGMLGTHKISSIGYTEPPVADHYVVVSSAKPVGYWRLGETSGVTAVDEIGTHNGTYVNTPTLGASSLIDGSSNTAVTFLASSNECVLITNDTSILLNKDYSMECWFKTSTVQATAYLMGSYNNTTNDGNGIVVSTNEIGIRLNPQEFRVSATIQNGVRHHVVVTYTDNSAVDGANKCIGRVYLDGVLILTTGSSLHTNTGSQFRIAGYGASDTKFFNGTVDEAAIYNRVLSNIEVFENYRSGVKVTTSVATGYSGLILSSSPAGYWRLGDLTGTVMTDAGPNAYNGTYAGSYTQGQTGIVGAGTDKALLLPGGTSTPCTISVTSRPQIDLAADFSLECWVKTTVGGQNTLVFGSYNGGPNTGHGLGVFGGSIFAAKNGASPAIISVSGLTNGNYHHLVATYSGSSPNIVMQIYYDGSPVGTVVGASVTAGGTLTVGAYSGSTTIFNGTIDECAVYSSVLSAAQVLANYNAGVNGIAEPPLPEPITKAYLLVDHTGASTRSGRVIESTIGSLSADYKAVTFGLSATDPSSIENLAAQGWSHRPYPVANPSVSGPESGAGTYIVSWVETSRLSQGWEDSSETPPDPQIDSYVIQVVNMANESIAVRTTTIVANSLSSHTYTSTQYTEDFGAVPVAVGFRIFAVIAGRAGNGVLVSQYLRRFKYINYI